MLQNSNSSEIDKSTEKRKRKKILNFPIKSDWIAELYLNLSATDNLLVNCTKNILVLLDTSLISTNNVISQININRFKEFQKRDLS